MRLLEIQYEIIQISLISIFDVYLIYTPISFDISEVWHSWQFSLFNFWETPKEIYSS